MLRRLGSLLFALTYLSPLGACDVVGPLDGAATDDARSLIGARSPAAAAAFDAVPGAPVHDPAPRELVFDDSQTPFAAEDPWFVEGGVLSDFTGTPLTDWVIDTVAGESDSDEFTLVFEHSGLALIDVAAGDDQLDVALDVFDLDGTLLVSSDLEGPGGLESVALEATAGMEPVVISVRGAGSSAGRYVVIVDAAD